ncbi:MAG TPA: TetR family transcriptional regulator [Thermoleophilaceae bacterium]|nr:TetR family transcriptional regulator [Thermoleophilaceae bacterium]
MPGLRERKKQQTREAIIRAAFRLFRKRGFDATTIADIAEVADISPRTFFSYFESKEAVVFHDFDEVREGLAAHLQRREPGETTFDALRAWVDKWVQNADVQSREHVARRELIRKTPALRAHDDANHGVFERLVAENVAADLGVPADSLRPRMVAAAAVAALSALGEVDAGEIADEPMAVVDEAVAFLQGGLGALQRKRPRR